MVEDQLTDSFLYICLTYIKPQAPIGQFIEHFNKVKDCILSLDDSARILILGDYNLRNIIWNIPPSSSSPLILNTCPRSEGLLTMIDFCNFNQINSVLNHNGVILDLVYEHAVGIHQGGEAEIFPPTRRSASPSPSSEPEPQGALYGGTSDT